MSKTRFLPLLMLFLGLAGSAAYGQLSPPGLDGARLVSWGAIGTSQQFSRKISSTVYAGGSSQSDPDNFSTFRKPAIFILNQETLYQFNTTWQLALCTSLRWQFVYDETAPYINEDPPWRKEIRHYLRLFYRQQRGKLSWTYSFRPEYRTFFTPDGDAWSSPVQIRLRTKVQVNIPLNQSRSNALVIANEWLGATSENAQLRWSSFQFTEDRLSTFFRHSFKKPQIFLDLGLMHQLWEDNERKLEYTTYLSFDLMFVNPFGTIKQG